MSGPNQTASVSRRIEALTQRIEALERALSAATSAPTPVGGGK